MNALVQSDIKHTKTKTNLSLDLKEKRFQGSTPQMLAGETTETDPDRTKPSKKTIFRIYHSGFKV